MQRRRKKSQPIENIMNTSMQHIKALADVNTVIGDPLVTEDNTMILPVSKVSLGLIVGGGEYLSINCKRERIQIEEGAEYPFIGASTVGMSLTPLAFLAVQDGSVRVLPAKQDCAAERLIDLIPQAIRTLESLMGAGRCCGENEEHTKDNRLEGARGAAARHANAAAEKAGANAEKAGRAASRAKSAVPPFGNAAEATENTPGHMIPTVMPQSAQAARDRAGRGAREAAA